MQKPTQWALPSKHLRGARRDVESHLLAVVANPSLIMCPEASEAVCSHKLSLNFKQTKHVLILKSIDESVTS